MGKGDCYEVAGLIALRDFKNALESHPDAFNVLLVDA